MTSHLRPRRHASIAIAAVLVLVGPLAAAAPPGAEDLDLTPVEVKASPDVNEVVPSGDGEYVAWAQNSVARPQRYHVFLRREGQPRVKVNRRGTQAGGGGFSGTTYVYSEWKPDARGTEIVRYDVLTGRRTTYGDLVNSNLDEFHPTLSGKWLLFTRHNDRRDVWRVLLHNTYSNFTRTLATGQGDDWVYAGQVSGNYVTWGRVRNQRQDVYRYDIKAKQTTLIPQAGFAFQYNPAIASDGTIYYSRGGDGCGVTAELVRYPVGGPAEVLHSLPRYFDTGYTYVHDSTDGSRDVYYATIDCRLPTRRRWDTFTIADSSTLTIDRAGTGTGGVSSAPAGIDCGADCTEVYPRGTEVTLTADPDSGAEVAGWSAPECPTATLTCTLTISDNRDVTVTFDAVAP